MRAALLALATTAATHTDGSVIARHPKAGLGPWSPPLDPLARFFRPPRERRNGEPPDPERDPEGYRRWEAARAKRERRAAKRRR